MWWKISFPACLHRRTMWCPLAHWVEILRTPCKGAESASTQPLPFGPLLLPSWNMYLTLVDGREVKPILLVHSVCYTQVPQMRVLTKSRDLLLTVLEAGNPRSEFQHVWVLQRAPFQVLDSQLFVCSSGGRDEGAPRGLLYKGTNPIRECSALVT